MMSNINYRKDQIPMWINLLNIVVIGILSFQMISALFNPTWAYGKFENIDANQQVILTLAGRNFIMIVITVLALKSQNALFLAIIFILNFIREFYDMILVGYLNHFSMIGVGMMSTFLIFLIPYILALKKLNQIASKAV